MIQGICSKCGFVFLLEYGLNCPVCSMAARADRVAQAFAPLDPLRTATGVRMDIDATLGYRWHGDDYQPKDSVEVPRGCKIPKTTEDQVYQLKRLFRL